MEGTCVEPFADGLACKQDFDCENFNCIDDVCTANTEASCVIP